jgi:HEAT repeat protein
MTDLVSQAEEIAQQGDWPRLTQYLHQHLLTTSMAELSQEQIQTLLPLAMQVLGAGDFSLRWDMTKILPIFGEVAVPVLTDLLQNEETELEPRWFAARILGDLNHPDAIRVLVELVQNPDDDLAEIAAGALANLGTPAIAALTQLLTDETTRPLAVQALAQIRRSETIAPLLTVVTDAQPNTRATAIEALSSFHDSHIPQVLVNALKDPSTAVRKAAISGLASRSDLAADFNLVERFAECLWDVNLDVCHQAIWALGRMGSNAAVAPLMQVLHSVATPHSLKQAIIRSLGWIGTQAALESLQQSFLAHLSPDILAQDNLSPNNSSQDSLVQANLSQDVAIHSSQDIVQEIVSVLGRWTNPDLKPLAAQGLVAGLALTQQSSQPQPGQGVGLRAAIAAALGQLQQPQTLDSLIQLLADPDDQVRLHAIAALKTFNLPSIRGHLENLQTDQKISAPLQQGIAIALTEWQIELPQ